MSVFNRPFQHNRWRCSPLITAFLFGVLAIILPRLLTPESFSPYATSLSALLAVIIVIFLGLYYHKSPEIKDISRAGDDLYYLGLLFTLVSLIYALVSLFIVKDVDADLAARTNTLIGNFGIALLSTVAGILGRIILQSMGESESRESPENRENPESSAETNLPNNNLHMFVRNLRTEMRGASDAFSHYNRMTMLQAEDTKRHAERMARNLNRRLEEDTRSAITLAEAAFQKMAAQIQETIEKTVQTTNDTLNRQSREIADVLTALVEQLSSANRSFAELPVAIEQTQNSINTLGKTLKHQSDESANVLAILVNQLDMANDSLAELPASIGQTQRSLDAFGETAKTAMVNLDTKASEIAKAYEAIARNASEQREIMSQDLKNTREVSTRMGSEVSGWTQHAEQIRATFEAINHSLTELVASIEQIQRSINAQRETAKSAFDDKIDEVSNACQTLTHTTHKQQETLEKILETIQATNTRIKTKNLLRRIFGR